jgi:hypothetical protein
VNERGAFSNFVDGKTRPVYPEPDGRQYVYNYDERVHGVWLVPESEPDLPFIVVRADAEE